jgi:hypothetical protein
MAIARIAAKLWGFVRIWQAAQRSSLASFTLVVQALVLQALTVNSDIRGLSKNASFCYRKRIFLMITA